MIIVTGGTGIVGAAVVRELLRRGERVAVLGRDRERIWERFQGPSIHVNGEAPAVHHAGSQVVDAREGDVRDLATLERAFAGCDVVIDCVQFPNSPIENRRKGWTFEEIDYLGTVNQIRAARATGVRRYVYVSGVGASPDADKHWFRFKWLAEEEVRRTAIPHVIIRPTWVYGPDDVSLNRFLGFARSLPFVPLFGDGKQLMQPIFVEDLARLLADAAGPVSAEMTVEAGGPDVMMMNDVIKSALDAAGLRKPILHQPVWLGKTVASILRHLPGPPLTPDAIDFITHEAIADNSEMMRVFTPRLTAFREGLGSYLAPPMEAMKIEA